MLKWGIRLQVLFVEFFLVNFSSQAFSRGEVGNPWHFLLMSYDRQLSLYLCLSVAYGVVFWGEVEVWFYCVTLFLGLFLCFIESYYCVDKSTQNISTNSATHKKNKMEFPFQPITKEYCEYVYEMWSYKRDNRKSDVYFIHFGAP